jgi:hypothetical protein
MPPLDILIAFIDYYFIRQITLQLAIEEIRVAWIKPELTVDSFNNETDFYECYNSTFGKILLRLRRNADGYEDLVNLTVVPSEPPGATEAVKAISDDLKKKKLKVELPDGMPSKNKSSVIRLSQDNRVMEVVISGSKLQMIILWEVNTGLPEQGPQGSD